MEMTIRSDMFGLSSTKHLGRNAVLLPGNDVVMMCWLCQLISRWGIGLNTSDLTQRSGLFTCIASDLVRCAKSTLVLYGVYVAYDILRQATINFYLWFRKFLGDSLPELYCVDLAEAYATQESVSSKILSEKKRYDLRAPNGCLHEKPLAKCGTGKENRY